jgi:SAM-dependent methyltransferase
MSATETNQLQTNMRRIATGRRLAYYREAASAQYWDDVWARQETQQLYAEAQKGELGYYGEIFPKYLSKEGRILEAGCGLGQFVIALRARDYDAEGVDYGKQTVDFIKRQFPDLAVRLGDVTNLDVPNSYYQGCISLGVMEHRKEGPEPFLKEAHRILAPGGIALISVPYLNFLRRLKIQIGAFKDRSKGSIFINMFIRPRNSMSFCAKQVLK